MRNGMWIDFCGGVVYNEGVDRLKFGGKMRLFFKQCISDDCALLRELAIKTFSETFADKNADKDMEAYLSQAFETNKLRNELLDGNSAFFFLYCDDKLAGYLKLNEAPSQTDINDISSLEIERIYVLNEYQGLGLGRYLMEQAVKIAIARKKKYAWLGVWEKNEKAIRFYKKNDFYKIGTHSFFVGDDEQIDHIMRKDLS